MEATTPMPKYVKQLIEEHGTSTSSFIPFIREVPKPELKEFSPHLRYAYLGENISLPVIISSSLTDD